jgi:hypothetical protein
MLRQSEIFSFLSLSDEVFEAIAHISSRRMGSLSSGSPFLSPEMDFQKWR